MPFDTTYSARTDSGSANNPALNLTGAPAVEITFVNQTATGGSGDYLLDKPAGGGVDPDTMVEIDGVLYQFTYELSGTLPTTKNTGAQQVPDQFEGDPVVIITVLDYPAPGDTTHLSFLPDSNATLAEMDAFGNGAINIQNIPATESPNPVCFVEGTLIGTPGGEVPIERLAEGHLVTTTCGGPMPVVWKSASALRWPGADPRHKPIRLAAGCLGGGLPRRDLAVSPQHRLVLSGADVAARFGHGAVLVPAKAMLGQPGVRQMNGKSEVVYHHMLLARHATVLAEGARTESFYPGPTALAMLSAANRAGLAERLAAMPGDYGPLAHPVLTCGQARRFLATRAGGLCLAA